MHTGRTNRRRSRATRRSRNTILAATAVLALPTALAATAPAADAARSTPWEDPYGVVYSVEFTKGKITESSVERLDQDAYGETDVSPKRLREKIPPGPGRIAPKLQKVLDKGTAKNVRVLVTYDDPVGIPRFPMPVFEEGRKSRTNQELLAQTQQMIKGIQAERAGLYREQAAQVAQLGGKVRQTFWLIQATDAVLPLEAVNALADRDDVRYLELSDEKARPPADSNPNNDVLDARQQLHSDPYFNLGQTSGWIGLLDTGVRTTHTLFTSPDHIAITQDLTGDGDPTDQCNHGTASAGLITGNSDLGNNWRGLSAISLDSWDIYGDDCLVGAAATVTGFQTAVSWLDKVIVAEVQLNASETSAASAAADAAYDSGAVVVAANGNFGPGSGTVRSPGNAHKALGIGAADLQTDALMSYSGRGPTGDGRYKPDLVFPTNVETSRNTSNTALGSFGGTSCATPIAGGAVALMRNWMRGGTGSIDAGHVYSQAILGGQTTWPFNNNTGAGPFVLGTGGHAWWGKVGIGNHGTVEIPISVASGKTKFEGALWWPEGASTHNDVDLALVSPAGTVFDSSISGVSVFERASVLSGLYPGTWKLRITGFSVSGSQTVYWSARTR